MYRDIIIELAEDNLLILFQLKDVLHIKEYCEGSIGVYGEVMLWYIYSPLADGILIAHVSFNAKWQVCIIIKAKRDVIGTADLEQNMAADYDWVHV